MGTAGLRGEGRAEVCGLSEKWTAPVGWGESTAFGASTLGRKDASGPARRLGRSGEGTTAPDVPGCPFYGGSVATVLQAARHHHLIQSELHPVLANRDPGPERPSSLISKHGVQPVALAFDLDGAAVEKGRSGDAVLPSPQGLGLLCSSFFRGARRGTPREHDQAPENEEPYEEREAVHRWKDDIR